MKYKLHALSAALSLALIWGIGLFIWTLVTAQTGYGAAILDLISSIYPSYEISTVGAIWGLLWGFVDAFIGTYLVVWLYNYFVEKFAK